MSLSYTFSVAAPWMKVRNFQNVTNCEISEFYAMDDCVKIYVNVNHNNYILRKNEKELIGRCSDYCQGCRPGLRSRLVVKFGNNLIN